MNKTTFKIKDSPLTQSQCERVFGPVNATVTQLYTAIYIQSLTISFICW